MKHLTLLLTLALASSSLAETATANDYFKQGEAALAKGNINTAKASYQKALALDPSHGDSKYRLLSMRSLSADARVKLRQRKLAAVQLKSVTFEDLTLQESLEALSSMVSKATNETFETNFVLEDPNKQIAENNVNIRLRNVPANVALKYILSQAKARQSWDEHVITVRPIASGGSTPASTSGQ